MTEGKLSDQPYSFSQDGKRLALSQIGNGSSSDIFTIPRESAAGPGALEVQFGKGNLFQGAPFRRRTPRLARATSYTD